MAIARKMPEVRIAGDCFESGLYLNESSKSGIVQEYDSSYLAENDQYIYICLDRWQMTRVDAACITRR